METMRTPPPPPRKINVSSKTGHRKGADRVPNDALLHQTPCRVGSVGSVSASRTVGREFASRPGHTKDHHKNGTNCLPA